MIPENDNRIPVNIPPGAQVVFAIQAKPKPRRPFIYDVLLALAFGFMPPAVLAVYLLVSG